VEPLAKESPYIALALFMPAINQDNSVVFNILSRIFDETLCFTVIVAARIYRESKKILSIVGDCSAFYFPFSRLKPPASAG
jgi:hypothetical protein